MTRRELLLSGAAASVLKLEAAPRVAPGPQNLSYPLNALQEASLTPSDLFFVRDHFREPQLSLESWQLRIDGQVSRPQRFGFSDLLELPSKTVEAVLECSGNGPHGSAVSNARWDGIPLSYLLDRAGINRGASFVALEGADGGRLAGDSPSLPFMQIVPLQKCLDASSLAAFKLNNLFLPRRNGFPVRALFPGWYAMNSVKWLQRITVLKADERPAAFFESGMNKAYTRVTENAAQVQTQRLSSIQVKSVIAWPANKLQLPAGVHQVWGFAWTGSGTIREITVSVDGGKNWQHTKAATANVPYQWVRWSYQWKAEPGDYSLLSRAADSAGNTQPIERDKTRKDGYELNWCAPLACSVR